MKKGTALRAIRTGLGCLLLVWITSLTAQTPAFITDSLDAWVDREMARWEVPGLAVTIVKDGRVVVQKGYGVRDLDAGLPVDEHTLFMIASNTKIFTGSLLALAAHEKKLSLEDPVRKWLPWFSLADPWISEQATLTDMVTHRLGLRTFQGDFLHWSSPLPPRTLVERMRHLSLDLPFRAAYGYCNVGFVAAGLALEEATRVTWHDAMRDRILQPLGMWRTSTRRAGIAGDANACKPYTLWEGELRVLDYPLIDEIGPAGSLNSSVSDISRWLIMQLDSGRYEGREILPWPVVRKTRDACTIVGTVRSSWQPSLHIRLYSLGWFMSDYGGTWLMEHGGGADGFLTTTAIVPDLGLGIAVFTNSDANSLYNALKHQILDAYLDLPYRNHSTLAFERAEAERRNEAIRLDSLRNLVRPRKTDPKQDARLTGEFEHPHFGRIVVARDGPGDLGIRFQDHPALEARLEPMRGGSYLCTYSILTYGVHVADFDADEGNWTLRVNDFVDRDEYVFRKVP